ncbi:MAG: hypothetical protein E8D45_11600 [Nitrospira sp.]|nr:MAG: hypothetical protein E8D45_11600 [Nitrospira sp.]
MSLANTEDEVIGRAVTKLHAGVLATVSGMIGGLALFMMTILLVIQDGPQVGQHLQLLSHYFIGYSVTWGGSLVGLFYGALTGALSGWAVGYIYNVVIGFRAR